ncbi:hypothetical protein SAMN05428944_7690 [Streptomyces sp. 1222.5]|nr:hypothetical protein BX260_0393 [Streptomyces sp. 5112.2]SED44167.1 hypothetical protein SAMN05428944_7690 [Streptomyces sp. 1222.5]
MPQGRSPRRRGAPGEVASRARPAGHTRPVAVEGAGRGRRRRLRRQHPLPARPPGTRLSYVLALNGKEVAHPEDVEPHQPAYGGLGPPTLSRYRTPPRAVCALAAQAAAERFTEVTWRQGSKGAMTSWFAVLTVRPAGKQSLAAAQEASGGRNRWDGVLPVETPLVEWPDGQDTPMDYWISNLPATTPVADLVRWAKMRWRIEHDYRELKHGLGLDHFEAAPGVAGTTTSPSSPPPRPSSLSGGSTQKSAHRPDPLPGPRRPSGPAEVLDRHLHHLRTPPSPPSEQPQTAHNLTKHY